MTQNPTTQANYSAWILADPADTELTEVDVRTLSTGRLRALLAEAAANGDSDLVATITSLDV